MLATWLHVRNKLERFALVHCQSGPFNSEPEAKETKICSYKPDSTTKADTPGSSLTRVFTLLAAML